MSKQNAIQLSGVSKTFDGFKALADANFTARWGEVHALLGENGAGKSSLMNIVAGLYGPEGGSLFIDDNPVKLKGPKEAAKLGIGMVHQHFKLVTPFTVAENILLNLGHIQTSGLYRERLAPGHGRHPRHGGADRLRHRPGRPHRPAVHCRTAAGGDPQGSAGRRQDPNSRRTHRRPDRGRGGTPAHHRAGGSPGKAPP